MSNSTVAWSKADEQHLKELQTRKDAWTQAAMQPIYKMITVVWPHVSESEVVAAAMIKHADLIRDALAPFDSGVRPAEEQS